MTILLLHSQRRIHPRLAEDDLEQLGGDGEVNEAEQDEHAPTKDDATKGGGALGGRVQCLGSPVGWE